MEDKDRATETAKLPKEFKDKWVAALRSGEYKRGFEQLRDRDSYCCLGVACRVAGIPAEKIEGNYIYPGDYPGVPETLHHEPTQNTIAFRLACMNDEGKSFAEIADYIEENL